MRDSPAISSTDSSSIGCTEAIDRDRRFPDLPRFDDKGRRRVSRGILGRPGSLQMPCVTLDVFVLDMILVASRVSLYKRSSSLPAGPGIPSNCSCQASVFDISQSLTSTPGSAYHGGTLRVGGLHGSTHQLRQHGP